MERLKLVDSILNLSWISVFLLVSVFGLLIFQDFTRSHEIVIDFDIEDIVDVSNEDLSIFEKGKLLFKTNCAKCHNKNMVDDLTGPALKGVTERWSMYPSVDLFSWIKNPSQLINAKHPKAIKLWEDWNKVRMNSFPNLNDEEIESILVYIER